MQNSSETVVKGETGWNILSHSTTWQLKRNFDASIFICLCCQVWSLRPCIPNFKTNIQVGFWVRTSFLRFPKFNFNVIFCNFWKPLLLTPKQGFPNFFRPFDPKTGFFDPKTGNYFRTYFRTIFAKFSRVKKEWIFLKNFQPQ